MAELIVTTGPNAGRHYPLQENPMIIGRSREQHLSQDDYLLLEDPEVSRRHLRLFMEQGQWYVEDIGSSNGTALESILLQSGIAYPLQNGAELQLGSTQLRFETGKEHFRIPSGLEAGSTGLDMDLATFSYPASASVQVISSEEHQPDVSMTLDATRFLEELQGKSAAISLGHEVDLVKRMQAMIQVSLALGVVTDLEALLARIMDFVFELFPGAERAFVVACDNKAQDLQPLILRYHDGRELDESDPIALSTTIVTEVIRHRNALLLKDALGDRRFGAQESVVNLSIRSVMCAPLLYENKVLGLLQVDSSSATHMFTQDDLELLTAISAQIAISMKNSRFYQEIENLFEGFVRASVQAIEARDPGTAGHSFRVAEYTDNLARAVDRNDSPALRDIRFDRDQLQELRYAALLHDFGKVGVREHVLTKAKRLYPHEIRLMRQRFRYARACLERQVYRELVEAQSREPLDRKAFGALREEKEAELGEQVKELNRFFEAIMAASEPDTNSGQLEVPLSTIVDYRFRDVHDEPLSLLNPFEFSVLSESQGSLNPQERREIESHVSHTFDFLKLIPWTEKFADIPDIAHAHHEKLDGSGYPRALPAEQIPLPSRIMTIADIYDALTAGDRPYRDGVNPEQALTLIEEQVRVGKLDEALFKVFIEAEAYKSRKT
ncbi:HD domain-containing phosphohydrolase [Thiohalophilus sp.]|uniref:HD domain-containing phosphohydrolase n=1 Tax=Thiohalophilus sp. TaxID=3028392 RepID=UPI002ACF08FA|nr:HD domain-containing phosphohydrolase [Thiohalophilus sp.]MDZ7663206.1 HD domain-containing phosphohydrolase [Thiohalophilus sp.]